MLIKPFFELLNKVFDTKNKRIAGVIILIGCLTFIYNTFFRYQYKVYYKKSYPQVIRVDRLTGKSIWYTPEYVEKK